MARLKYNVAIKTGTYTDRNTGQEKGRWKNVGVVLEGDNGNLSMKLEAIPLGMVNDRGEAGLWFSFFEPRQEGQGANAGGGFRQQQPQGQFGQGQAPAAPQGQPTQQQQTNQAFQDSDIPF